MKTIAHLVVLLFISWACSSPSAQTSTDASATTDPAASTPAEDGKGVGEIKQVALNDPLDEEMIKKGKAIYDMKCSACHKLTGNRLVGPTFKGVTERRKPEWIMNMITNVEIMLEEDPTAQQLLEECLTRMPNQNVSLEDARDVLEFLYDNDSQE